MPMPGPNGGCPGGPIGGPGRGPIMWAAAMKPGGGIPGPGGGPRPGMGMGPPTIAPGMGMGPPMGPIMPGKTCVPMLSAR